MQLRRWVLGLVITMMLIDSWAERAEATFDRIRPYLSGPPVTQHSACCLAHGSRMA